MSQPSALAIAGQESLNEGDRKFSTSQKCKWTDVERLTAASIIMFKKRSYTCPDAREKTWTIGLPSEWSSSSFFVSLPFKGLVKKFEIFPSTDSSGFFISSSFGAEINRGCPSNPGFFLTCSWKIGPVKSRTIVRKRSQVQQWVTC